MDATATLQKLKAEPLFLLKTIIGNNPEAVAAKLQAFNVGLSSELTDAQNVLDVFIDFMHQATLAQTVEVLNVPYMQPLEENQLNDAVLMRSAELVEQGINAPLYWGYLFKDAATKIPAHYADFIDNLGPKRTAIAAKPAQSNCAFCAAMQTIKQAAPLLLIVLVLVLIIKRW